MPITAAAAWALFSATQSNAAARDAAFAAGALDPLLLLVEGSGAQVCPALKMVYVSIRDALVQRRAEHSDMHRRSFVPKTHLALKCVQRLVHGAYCTPTPVHIIDDKPPGLRISGVASAMVMLTAVRSCLSP